MPEPAEKESSEFNELVLRTVGRLQTLASTMADEFKGSQFGSVPSAFKMMLILLTGMLKAHGLTVDDIIEVVVESYDDVKMTTKTPFIGKGGSA